MYLLGIEASERKTHCLISDEKGNIFAEGFGGAANYKEIGHAQMLNAIGTAVQRSLDKLNLKIEDIACIVVGISGLQDEEERALLVKMCKPIFGEVPLEILNDAHIILRAGNEAYWGVVTHCNSGHSTFGRNRKGDSIRLRSVEKEVAIKGGVEELVREGIYYALKSEEGIIGATKLQQEIPKLFGKKDMYQVSELIRSEGIKEEIKTQFLIMINTLGKQRDKIAQSLLINMGKVMGQSVGAVIRKLGEQDEAIPIILTGAITSIDCPILFDAYMLEIHKIAPCAYLKVLENKPAVGACALAIETLHKTR